MTEGTSLIMTEGAMEYYQNLYREEFDEIFSKKDYFKDIHKKAKSGFLKNSQFRSVCWRLYLNQLPKEKDVWWVAVIRQRQSYDELKIRHHIDPRLNMPKDDNPLSTSEMSQWNGYFEDKKLQLVIYQDVIRTFPDQDLFKDCEIQEMMVEILFIYARTYPEIQYKQGMHELLAPIIYVMQKDIKLYDLAMGEGCSILVWFNYLFMGKFVEHDCYTMFVKVMDIVSTWYIMDCWEKNEELLNCVQLPADSLHTVLQDIWGRCKMYDREVYEHLNNLEIPPQIYGIRWLKLLFGREFEFEDLFIVWDVIISDSTQRNIYKYIFIAMLISIRHLLLNSDYSSCISHLMKFPRVESVEYILDLAFHLRNPTKYRRPENSNASLAALFKKKEETKVKTAFFSSRLGSSSIGKNCATRPKTVDINPEKTTFFFKKGLYSKGSSAEESSLSDSLCIECSEESFDFSEPSQASTSLSLYGTFPRSRIPNVMGITTQTQRASEFIKLQGSSNDNKTLERHSREMESIAPRIQSDVPRREVSDNYRHPENTNTSLAAFKKKEDTKVKTAFFSSSVGLGSSSIGKKGANCPKTVDKNLEKDTFFFKKSLYSKGSSAEKASLSVECSDFYEPCQSSSSLSSEPTSPYIQSDVPSREVSVEIKEKLHFMSSKIINMNDKNEHCAKVLNTVIEDLREVAINQAFPGVNKIFAALQELERIKLVLKDIIPFDDSTCPYSHEEPLSDIVQDIASIAVKETERYGDEESIEAKEKFTKK